MYDKNTGKWTEPLCYLSMETNCDGHMVLKDISFSKGSIKIYIEDGETMKIYYPRILTKIWVCDKCGFVFEE